MTISFPEDEEDDELLLGTLTGADEDDDELVDTTLEDVKELEEEASAGHRLQTYHPEDDGVDDYFDERYFDE